MEQTARVKKEFNAVITIAVDRGPGESIVEAIRRKKEVLHNAGIKVVEGLDENFFGGKK